MGHDFQDRVGLEMGKRIAAGPPEHPQWLDLARANVERWAQTNSNSPGLMRCYAEWRLILDRPVIEICAGLIAETAEGQRLRQNSPFAAVLPPREVWELRRRLHDPTPA